MVWLQKHPEATSTALEQIMEGYEQAPARARSGAALAVKACADLFGDDMLMTALHFLLEHGLADMAQVQDQKATISEQMMQAGESHYLPAEIECTAGTCDAYLHYRCTGLVLCKSKGAFLNTRHKLQLGVPQSVFQAVLTEA